MNFNSLITKIIFIFTVSITLFIAVFIGTYYYEYDKLNKEINNNYAKTVKFLRENRLVSKDAIRYIEKLNFKLVNGRENIRKILNTQRVSSGPAYEVFKKDNIYYLHIMGPGFRLLFEDSKKYSLEYYSFMIISLIFMIYILSFLWIIKALKPLKNLKEEIQSFSNGNLNINCKSDKKDEIAQVANEFDNAAKKISLLLNSRQLFLRTVMHELKTPIAKGRIVSELVDDKKQKDRMILIFDKLNYLINNFSKIEEIVSKNYKINRHPVKLDSIIKNSLEMMLIDNSKDKILIEDISNKSLDIDLELFSLALKNLLENGIKYSFDKKVKIKETKTTLEIISKGEKLQKPINEYFKAYHNETKSKNHGMGLGLYIVHEILKMHQMNLKYEYIDGENIFKIPL